MTGARTRTSETDRAARGAPRPTPRGRARTPRGRGPELATARSRPPERRPDLALGDIVALCAAVLATAVAFWRVHRVAALLMLPYLAWLVFAAALNYAVVRLNPAG